MLVPGVRAFMWKGVWPHFLILASELFGSQHLSTNYSACQTQCLRLEAVQQPPEPQRIIHSCCFCFDPRSVLRRHVRCSRLDHPCQPPPLVRLPALRPRQRLLGRSLLRPDACHHRRALHVWILRGSRRLGAQPLALQADRRGSRLDGAALESVAYVIRWLDTAVLMSQ